MMIGQQIVEVVRDAAGQLADGLHLLRLAQRRRHALALLDLGAQLAVGGGELAGALGDPELERVGQIAQRHDQPLALVLDLLALGDVEHRADVAEEGAAGGEARQGRIERPAIDAIRAPQPVLEPERQPVGMGREEGRARARPVVRMDDVEPAEAEAGRFGLAAELVPGAPEVGARAVRIGDPDHHRRAVGHGPEAGLALAQGGLGLAALGDLGLSGLIEPGVVDRDRRLGGDAGDEALGALAEHAGLRVAEEQAAEDLARARDDRHRQIAAHRQVALGMPWCGALWP